MAISLTLAGLAFNLAFFPAYSELDSRYGWEVAETFSLIGAGILAGEIAIFSTFIVWANGNFLLRLVGLWLAGLAAYGCWYLGAELSLTGWDQAFHRSQATDLLTALPPISLALQLPQWWMRVYLHWRLAKINRSEKTNIRESLSIRDILIGTTVVAVTLTVVRFWAEFEEINSGFWLRWTIALGILLMIGQLILMPLVAFILRWRLDLAAIAFTLIAPVSFPVVIAVIATIGGNGGPPKEAYILGYLAFVASLVTFSAPLWIARFAGYRLVTHRSAP